MIYIFYGDNDFSRHQALKEIKEGIGPPELQEANTSVLQGSQITLPELAAACDTVPFLSEKRLVVVEKLLSSQERRGRRQRGRQVPTDDEDSRAIQWQGLVEHFQSMPSTTELVFLEGPLRNDNPLLAQLRQLAKVVRFPSLSGEALHQWIRTAVVGKGGRISPAATRSLAELVGGNLWVMDNEVEKLCLYTDGREIQKEDVEILTTPAREASIFAAVDAVLEGTPSLATELFHRILQSGAGVPYVLSMLARQVRFLILAKEAKGRGVSNADIGKRLGISAAFALRKTLNQERNFTLDRLKEIYSKLLETDLSIKTGKIEEEIALDLLVAQLCSEPSH